MFFRRYVSLCQYYFILFIILLYSAVGKQISILPRFTVLFTFNLSVFSYMIEYTCVCAGRKANFYYGSVVRLLR